MSCTPNFDDLDPISIVQGEDVPLTITVFAVDGTLYDLTGAKIYFTVKRRWKDSSPLITKSTLNAGGGDDQIHLFNAGDQNFKCRSAAFIIQGVDFIKNNGGQIIGQPAGLGTQQGVDLFRGGNQNLIAV